MRNSQSYKTRGRRAGLMLIFGICLSTVAGSLWTLQVVADDGDQQLKHGEKLVLSLGCNDCHTPLKLSAQGPTPDMSRMLSGHPEKLQLPPPPKIDPATWAWVGSATNTAFAGPWGITYAINLTPDRDTGLGKWTDQMFIETIKQGKHLGFSRPIMPPMPWQSYSHLSKNELKAVFAYLKTIPAIHNQAPFYAPPQATSGASAR